MLKQSLWADAAKRMPNCFSNTASRMKDRKTNNYTTSFVFKQYNITAVTDIVQIFCKLLVIHPPRQT